MDLSSSGCNTLEMFHRTPRTVEQTSICEATNRKVHPDEEFSDIVAES